MNVRLLLILLVLSVYYAACAQNGAPTGPSQEDISNSRQEIERAQAQAEQQISERMSPDRAKQLAARHLALQQTSWGKPVGVTEDEERFYVSYETPQTERRLIGSRMLVVDKETGVVTSQKRR